MLNRFLTKALLRGLSFFLFFLSFTSIYAQYGPFYKEERGLEKYPAYEAFRQGILLYNNEGDFEKVIKTLDSAANASLQAGKNEQYLFFRNEMANLHKHQNHFLKAHEVLEKSMDTFQSNTDTVHIEYFVSQRLLRATLNSIRNLPGKSDFKGRAQLELFQSMFNLLEALNEKGEPMRNTLVDYGLQLFRQGKQQKAIETLYKARSLALEANDFSSLAVADYSIISKMQSSFDLLNTQNEVLKNDIELFEAKQASIPVLLYNTYFLNKVSQNYYEHFNNLDQAVEYGRRAAKLLDTLKYPAHNIKAATHGNLAKYYSEKGDTLKMWSHVKKASQLVATQPMSAYNRAFGYVLISEAVQPYAPDTAMAYLQVLDTLPGKQYFENKITEIKVYAHLKQGQMADARELILSAFDEFEDVNGHKVPRISASKELVDQYYFMNILQDIYMAMEKQEQAKYTDAIVKLINQQNTIFQKIRAQDIYGFEVTELATLYNDFLKEALPYMFQLKDKKYLTESMNLALTSKAIHMNALMAKNKYQAMLENDTALFSRLLNSSRQVQDSRNKLASANTKDENRLNELQMELNSNLIDNLMLRYEIDEDYRNQEMEAFQKKIKVASITDVQSQLLEDEALIEYYILDDSWAQLLVLPDTVMRFYHKGEALYDKIEAERYAVLTGRKTTGIGETLFMELMPYLDKIKKLVIVPDANLNYIPFEWFEVNSRMIIEDYAVSYSYSTALWHNLRKENKFSQPKSLLAVAPLFDEYNNNNDNLMVSGYRGEGGVEALPHTLEEVRGIKGDVTDDLINAKQLIGKEANLGIVKEALPDYDILHFATHGIVNANYPERSGLFLYRDGTSETTNSNIGLLTLGELFNMQLSADLMVLSACNTGRGDYLEGEGVMALPRGGILAGVPRVIASLWKVQDERTKDIMLSFYNYLLEGHTYREALRLAKLDAIQSGFLVKNWAGFILIGA